MGRPPTPPEVRFWTYVNKTDSCWLWTGAISSRGYGNFRGPNSRQVGAHIYSYELVNGPVPQGMFVDHACRVQRCVNPDHLAAKTNKENQENRGDQANADNLSTGVRGVHKYTDRERYRVVVRHNGKAYYGGSFPLDQLAEAQAAAVSLRNDLFTNNLVDRGVGV
jgi:hypothetical protein